MFADAIEGKNLHYEDIDIYVGSIDIGGGNWFLKIVVDSFSAETTFRFDTDHLTYDQLIDFSDGKRDLYSTHGKDSAAFECIARDGFFIFTVDHSIWKTSIKVPIELLGGPIYDVITAALNGGYLFGTEIPRNGNNGGEGDF